MKKVVRWVFACALAGLITVGAGLCAMAADTTIEITSVTVDSTAQTAVVSGAVTNVVDGQLVTIIVVPQGVSLTTLTDDQIRYLAQKSAPDGTFSYNMALSASGSYDVYVGGSSVAAPDSDTFSMQSAFAISGTLQLENGAKFDTVTAVATANQTPTSGTVTAEGVYTIEVAPGTYEVVVGRPGYLYKTYSGVTVTDAPVALGTLELLAGDVKGGTTGGDSVINMLDVAHLMSNFFAVTGDANFDAVSDFNDDGIVNMLDVASVLANYFATYGEGN